MKPKFNTRGNRRMIWWAVLIGGSAVVAVISLQQSPAPLPQEEEVIEVRMVNDGSAPEVTKKTSAVVIADPVVPPAKVPDENRKHESTQVAEKEPAAQLGETPDKETPVSASGFADEPLLLLTGMDSTRDAAAKRDAELLDKAITTGEWDAYRALLARSIQSAIGKLPDGEGLNRYDPVWNGPVLYRTLLRWKTLANFSRSVSRIPCQRSIIVPSRV